ncbi:hypothetical protein H2200_002994 [Cladophialophora chaetospira]|uniref:Rhodopsin domain-containing protein n=1 Tax=Cladophialophora chaetospira TaxID=386627 RepID=A0AA39CMB5_9EURO|nr:hypothetical protein H2200_002994 [Cladophialophora chaetospira]
MALQCDFAHPWITLHQRCENVSLRWKVINALDIATEVMLLATAVFLVWSLQTSVTRKVTVVTGFACRLPIIIAIGFRLGTFDQAGLTTDPSLRETLFIVWTQTELNYSLISASNPSLLQFMRNLNTHFGGVTERENATYGSHKSSSHSFPMSILRSGNKTNASQNRSHTHTGENDDVNGYGISRAKAPALKNKGSVGSGDSQKYIIQKDISYTVEYE